MFGDRPETHPPAVLGPCPPAWAAIAITHHPSISPIKEKKKKFNFSSAFLGSNISSKKRLILCCLPLFAGLSPITRHHHDASVMASPTKLMASLNCR